MTWFTNVQPLTPFSTANKASLTTSSCAKDVLNILRTPASNHARLNHQHHYDVVITIVTKRPDPSGRACLPHSSLCLHLWNVPTLALMSWWDTSKNLFFADLGPHFQLDHPALLGPPFFSRHVWQTHAFTCGIQLHLSIFCHASVSSFGFVMTASLPPRTSSPSACQ